MRLKTNERKILLKSSFFPVKSDVFVASRKLEKESETVRGRRKLERKKMAEEERTSETEVAACASLQVGRAIKFKKPWLKNERVSQSPRYNPKGTPEVATVRVDRSRAIQSQSSEHCECKSNLMGNRMHCKVKRKKESLAVESKK
jgi:hypothetical protein